jgi:hypothetical protein
VNDFTHGFVGIIFSQDKTITGAISVRRQKRQPSLIIVK